jgi:LEA14-like dessication related protein
MNKKYLLFSGIGLAVGIGGFFMRRLYEQSVVLTEIKESWGKTKIVDISKDKVTIQTDLILTNESKLNAKIKGGQILVYVDDVNVGIVKLPKEKITLKAKSSTTLPLRIDISTSNALSTALGGFLGTILNSENVKDSDVVLDGVLKVGVGFFMFDYNFYDKSKLNEYLTA